MYLKPEFLTSERLERWAISGALTTLSPLHLGDGGHDSLDERRNKAARPDQEQVEFATVFRSHDGVPIIPGSSLKGALRAWVEAHNPDNAVVQRVFGNLSRGCGITFHDARLTIAAQPKAGEVGHRDWNPKLGTAVMPHVVIDPHTRSAQEHLLFHVEYVPAGSVFTLEISAQGITPDDRQVLLSALRQAFTCGTRPARLGADTANGWGRVQWEPGKVRVFNPAAWMAGPIRPWREALEVVDEPERSKWLAAGSSFTSSTPGSAVRIRLKLNFDGPMLVHDPTREKRSTDGEDAVGHSQIRDAEGRPFVPASSVRGAFRSQAGRIWQTLAFEGPEDIRRGSASDSAPKRGSEQNLGMFWKMFGGTGWRSPLEFEDLLLDGPERQHKQEFVAIDRFTGGAAPQKKFTAEGLMQPCFTGALTLRPDRWATAKAGDWTWLVLLWTLRDWCEGDGALGFGASKGWGRFHAQVEIQGPSAEAALIAKALARNSAALSDSRFDAWEQSLRQAIGRTA